MNLKALILIPLVGAVGLGIFAATLKQPIPSLNINTEAANAGTQPSSPEQSQPSGAGNSEDKSRVAVARDAYLDKAIDTLDSQLANIVCTRKNLYLSQAQEWSRQTGGSTEKWLLDKLDALKNDSAKNSNAFTGLDGSTDQFTYSKNFSLDALALMTALQEQYKGEVDKGCVTNFATSFQDLDKFQREAQTYRALLEQRQQQLTQSQGGTDGSSQ
jgi:hypothetical protein